MGINFFKKIYSEDIIYHYTKTPTAIDYILFNEQLKFSERVNSIDPTESRKASRSIVSTGHFADLYKDINFHNESNQLNDIVSNLENSFNQISFCKNYIGHEFASEYYSSQFEGHEEIFGFTKPRMWERYADNYSGVCLAFSRKKILDLNEKRFKLICKDVEYLNYRELTCRKVDYISGNYLLEVGYDKYKEHIKQIAESSFFCKHIDYDGEHEFRIGTYYEEANCSPETIKGEFKFGKTMMLDVKGCLEAIFISSYANLKQKNDLLNYAEKLNVPIIEMVWKHDSFEPIDYKQEVDFYKNLSQSITDTPI